MAEGLQPDPLSVTAHFLRPPAPGPVTIQVETVRSGRVHATYEAHLRQDGAECLRALAVFGTLGRAGGAEVVAAAPPDLTPLEHSVAGTADLPDGTHIPIAERFDVRYDPRTTGWAAGRPSGRPEVGAWVRFADGREPDLAALLVVVDALPPTVFELGLAGWVPTLELTTHLRAHPAPGWLRVWVRTRLVLGGYLEEDAEVWDSAGTLVAMSRQLALAPRG
jgi:acyl-CoA thioesterase